MKTVSLTLYRAKLATLDARAQAYGGKRLAKSGHVYSFEVPEDKALLFTSLARQDDARHVTIHGGINPGNL